MKKICFFISDLNSTGGTERVSTTIANFLSNKDYSVSMLSLSGGRSPYFKINDKINTFNLFEQKTSFTTKYFTAILKLRRFIIEHEIDVLVNVDSILSLYSVPALIGLNVRNVCWEHFNYKVDLGLKVRKIARQISAIFCDDVITLTERDKKFWKDNCWCLARVSVISNPIPFNISEHNPDPSNKLVLSVGRLTYQKGFDILLECWSSVIKDASDWRLRIVGSGEHFDMLNKMINDLNLRDSVELVSATKDIDKHYKEASLYAMSSRFEGFPMVLLEASTYNIPIVSFDCDTGPAELITDGYNGWLCENNIDSLVTGLLNAIKVSNDKCEYQRISNNSKMILNKFSENEILLLWERFLSI